MEKGRGLRERERERVKKKKVINLDKSMVFYFLGAKIAYSI